jgi:lipopolysaccharide export system permease protein
MPTLIDRYIMRELAAPFALTVVFFTFVFLMARILEITNLVVNYQIDVAAVVLMLAYAMPRFLEFVVPMSVMMAVLLTLLRLSGDNEIVALKAGGIGICRLLPPVMAFALAGALLTALMTLHGAPWGRTGIKSLLEQAANADLSLAIKERTFNDGFDGVMLYVSRIDPQTHELEDVFIQDQRNAPLVIVVAAPRGQLAVDPQNRRYRLRLFEGSLQRVDLSRRTADTVHFDTYDIALAPKTGPESAGGGAKTEKEMSLGELRRLVASLKVSDPRYLSIHLEWQRKFSIPAACLVLAFMALPMGIQSRNARRSFGLGLGLITFLGYYLLLSAGKVLGESGRVPPVVGMWMPNMLCAALGGWLLWRGAGERPWRWPWGRGRS